MKKLPPIEKVFEAWTAIAGDRVKMHDGYADVSSSDGEKAYVVKFHGDQYSSNDNATFWQGYPGYPVIAVLMIQGKIPYDPQEAMLWKDINWTLTNKKHHNKYAEAVADIAQQRGIDLQKAYQDAEKVMQAISALPIEIKRKISV